MAPAWFGSRRYVHISNNTLLCGMSDHPHSLCGNAMQRQAWPRSLRLMIDGSTRLVNILIHVWVYLASFLIRFSIVLHNILDDTGSDCLELFADDDCVKLGLTPSYQYWGPNITLETSNGTVRRQSIALAVQLYVNSAPFGPGVLEYATISPGLGGNQERASGMALRQNLFTGMSPYGAGSLLLSDTKTGVTRSLTAKPR